VGGTSSSGGATIAGGTTGTGGAAETGGTATGGGSGGTGPSTGILPGTQHYNCDPPVGERPELELTPYVTTGLDLPIYLTHAPNDVERLFVIEQAGRIKVVKNGVVNATPFLDIVARVSIDPWEQGLLGLAFHPDYAENGLFYVHYSAKNVSGVPNQANVVAEYKVSAANPDLADATSERILLTVDTDRGGQYLGYHNGGSIFFGLNKELFIAFGDGAGRGMGEAANNAQSLTTLRGKLVRINPLKPATGDAKYSIPAGNLTEEMPTAAPEIWSYGLRNPFRVNMDPCNGDIYIGDVGHFDWEEVDVEPAGSGHHNYGWPVLEGETCFTGGTCQEPANYRAPFVSYSHNGGTSAVIGGSVYRGSAIPGLRGTYLHSNLYGGTGVFNYDSTTDTISAGASVEEETNVQQMQQTIVSIQPGGDGELYFLGRGGSDEPDGDPVAPSVIFKLEAYVP
jgi:glucose/arabinose dehydrogenase